MIGRRVLSLTALMFDTVGTGQTAGQSGLSRMLKLRMTQMIWDDEKLPRRKAYEKTKHSGGLL